MTAARDDRGATRASLHNLYLTIQNKRKLPRALTFDKHQRAPRPSCQEMSTSQQVGRFRKHLSLLQRPSSATSSVPRLTSWANFGPTGCFTNGQNLDGATQNEEILCLYLLPSCQYIETIHTFHNFLGCCRFLLNIQT